MTDTELECDPPGSAVKELNKNVLDMSMGLC